MPLRHNGYPPHGSPCGGFFCIFLQIEAHIYYAEAKIKTRPAKEAKMTKQKSFEKLTFADNYMFTVASYDAKSIRLDVRTSDPEHEYDIEMQATDKKRLAPSGALLPESYGHRVYPARNEVQGTEAERVYLHLLARSVRLGRANLPHSKIPT